MWLFIGLIGFVTIIYVAIKSSNKVKTDNELQLEKDVSELVNENSTLEVDRKIIEMQIEDSDAIIFRLKKELAISNQIEKELNIKVRLLNLKLSNLREEKVA